MKTKEINIRDPYIMTFKNKYYLYGTRSATCWTDADGFDCYVSENLEDWEGPFEIFHRPEGFFATQNYWAPECIYSQGAFYLVTTFGAPDCKKGAYILRSEQPTGPFTIYSERITPQDWACIDATIYMDEDTPYLIFSHTLEDVPDGDICVVELSKDLKKAVSSPVKLFAAYEAKWANPIPFGKEEFGIDGPAYFSDGPCLMKFPNGYLYMTWSSWGTHGYAVGTAVAKNGNVFGPWEQLEIPIYPEDDGHGMFFRDLKGVLRFTLHGPNERYKEHPIFLPVVMENDELRLKSV